jgi:hypothetical protein
MAGEDTGVIKQLAELTEDVRRLTTQFNKATTTKIQSRSPTPERSDRRVHVSISPSPPVNEGQASSATYDRYAHSAPYSGHNQRTPFNYQPSSSFNQRGRFGSQLMPASVVVTGPCTRCARTHSKRGYCPAMDPSKRCNFCGKQFHFQAACFAAARQHQY